MAEDDDANIARMPLKKCKTKGGINEFKKQGNQQPV
jgi:hypothetical protein